MAGPRDRGQNRTGLIVTIIVLALTVVIVGGIVLLQNTQPRSDTASEQAPGDHEVPAVDQPDESNVDQPDLPAVDPATVSTIAITPLSIVVAYTKGTPGFEFQVLRNGQGTQYVVFSSPDLVGTKCSDDDGRFASIIKDPKDEDEQTITQSAIIDGTPYGLALATDTCTGDVALLKRYQTSFTDGFPLLRVAE